MNTLQKYNNFNSDFELLTKNIFNAVFQDPFFAHSRNWAPEDFVENERDYSIEVELPRFSREEIEVKATDNSITIKAKNKNKSYLRSFETWDADTEKTDVKLENGVLTVRVPKKPEAVPKERLLEIK